VICSSVYVCVRSCHVCVFTLVACVFILAVCVCVCVCVYLQWDQRQGSCDLFQPSSNTRNSLTPSLYLPSALVAKSLEIIFCEFL